MSVTYPTISVEEARTIDSAAVKALGIPSLMLMENAARGICQMIRQDFVDVRSIMIACGFGNNGGDGLALTRLLAAEGIDAHTYLIDAGRPLSADADQNKSLLMKCGLPFSHDPNGEQFQADVRKVSTDCLIVDCLLGTGIQGNPRAPYDNVIESVNRSAARVLAVDVPSGLNAQTGVPGVPAVVANQTITFVGTKVGFQTTAAHHCTGEISVAPIGLPLSWTMSFLEQHRDRLSTEN